MIQQQAILRAQQVYLPWKAYTDKLCTHTLHKSFRVVRKPQCTVRSVLIFISVNYNGKMSFWFVNNYSDEEKKRKHESPITQSNQNLLHVLYTITEWITSDTIPLKHWQKKSVLCLIAVWERTKLEFITWSAIYESVFGSFSKQFCHAERTTSSLSQVRVYLGYLRLRSAGRANCSHHRQV